MALLVSGGLIYFSLAVLVSSLVEGEFTAPAVAYGLTVLSVMSSETLMDFVPTRTSGDT